MALEYAPGGRGEARWSGGLAATGSDPARKLVAVTKSDVTTYDPPLRALWVGGAGNVAVIAADDADAVTITEVAAGTLLPIACSKVMSTNTTATLIIGLR
jgi:hypothetical protein